MVMRNRASALLLEFPCPSSQKIGLLDGPCAKRLSLVRKWRRRFGTAIIAKSMGAYQMGCRLIEMHPARSATGATKNRPKKPTTHPNLMFPLPDFGCLRGVFAARGCCNLLHFVHKLLHTYVDGDKSCILFTKCSQTVAQPRKVAIRLHDRFLPVAFGCEGANSSKVDGN